MARDVSKTGLRLIQSYEELRLVAYDDHNPNRKLEKGDEIEGTLTIGWGHTGPCTAIGVDSSVYIGQSITEEEADTLFRQDIDDTEADVERTVKVELNENEYAALVSFTYNCGVGALRTLVGTRLNKQNDRVATAEAFAKYNKSTNQKTGEKVVMPGLVRRRAEEAALFLKPVRKENNAGTSTPDNVTKGRDLTGAVRKASMTAGGVGTTIGALWSELGEYGIYAVGLAVAIVIGIGAFLYFKSDKKDD